MPVDGDGRMPPGSPSAATLWGALGALGGVVAFFVLIALIGGLGYWDGDWDGPLEVVRGRRGWLVLDYDHAWQYFVPLLIAEAAGILLALFATRRAVRARRRRDG